MSLYRREDMFLYLDGCQERLEYLIVEIIWSFSWLPLNNFVNNMLKEYMCVYMVALFLLFYHFYLY